MLLRILVRIVRGSFCFLVVDCLVKQNKITFLDFVNDDVMVKSKARLRVCWLFDFVFEDEKIKFKKKK